MTSRWLVTSLAAFAVACGSSSPQSHSPASNEPPSNVRLPLARHATPLPDGITARVSVEGDKVLCNGRVVDSTESLFSANAARRLDGEWQALKEVRDAWKSTHPSSEFPGVVVLSFEASTRALVVKSAFQTAAFAGFPNEMFAVRGEHGELLRLDVDAFVPRPLSAPVINDELVLDASVSGVEVSWREPGKLTPIGHATLDDLAERAASAWKQHGRHREATDPASDNAAVFASNDVDYAQLVAVLDAVASTTRGRIVDGARHDVPAMTATFYIGSAPTAPPPATSATN